MFGTVTLAIVMLSTATKLARARTMPPTQSMQPLQRRLLRVLDGDG